MRKTNNGFAFAFLFLATVILMTSCQREVDPGPGPNPGPGGVIDNEMVTASVRGIVVDQDNNPVQGATVTSGTGTTTTDRYGVFRFNNISLSRNNGYVRVRKNGFFTGSRTFVTTAGRTHNVRIRLLPRSISGTFAANAGGTVTLPGGGKMVMPAAAIADASGNPYSGNVDVAMTWIDPSSPNLSEILIGDLRGITTSNEERVLKTYGMLGVEMTGSGGQPLKIASGKTAELSFPIPASMLANAPATIDLWHFDETRGRWIQEGSATKIGNSYVGNVNHFSFWNCDAPFPLVDICFTIINAGNNQPLNNVHVRIKRADGSYASAYTDSLGNICGKVPKNELLTLEVLDQCLQVAYSQAIGPFSSNTNLGTLSVSLPSSNTLTITGTLTNCANSNVTNGAVVVYTSNTNSYSVPVTNGSFSITILRCSNSTSTFSIKGVDLATMQESTMYTGTGTSGTLNIGTLQACGSGLSEFIEYIIDGVPYVWPDLGSPNEVMCDDSTSSVPGYTTKTVVFAQWVVANNANTTWFRFLNNETPGVYPIDGGQFEIKINDPGGNWILKEVLTPNPTVNITAFGPPGGNIEGNFNLLFDYLPGQNMNVICNFKVKR